MTLDPRVLQPGAKADPELDTRTHRCYTGEGLSLAEREREQQRPSRRPAPTGADRDSELNASSRRDRGRAFGTATRR
jgi:hypothetical protein